jgi:hypothetical protein
MHTDHAVFLLAYGPAVLALDTGGFVAFLDKSGLIYDPHTVRMAVSASHMLLEAISDGLLVPVKQTEELLQIPSGFTDRISHRLNALARQVAQLALDVQIEVAAGRDATETVIKLVQKTSQFGFDPQNRTGVHTDDLPIGYSFLLGHWIAA